jgi:threonine aldolase
MRFLAAPWVGMLEGGAWLRHARHANAMAERMHALVAGIPGVEVRYPRQANSIFLALSPAVRDAMHERGWHFYDFIGWGGARIMCSWDTTEEDVRAFARDLAEVSAPVVAR